MMGGLNIKKKESRKLIKMKTKFKQSNISISGQVVINIVNGVEQGEIEIGVDLNGSKGKTKSGVYCLRNKLNGRLYIGQARNLENRYNRHMRDLRTGEHCNNIIYQDYISYCGEGINDYPNPQDIFEFEVIIYCRPSELCFYEHLLISNLQPYYNIHKQKETNIDKSTLYSVDELLWEDNNLEED